MAQIALDKYRDHAITVDTQYGRFETIIDGDVVQSTALADLHGKIDRIAALQLDAARKAQKPVPVLALVKERHDRDRLLSCTILGIHAGRTSRKALRVLADGQKTSLDIGYNDAVVVLHPNDPRADVIKAHLHAIAMAEVNLHAAQQTYRDFRASLPTVRIPEVESKEVAVREEPAFLAAIQGALEEGLATQRATTG